MFFQNHFYCSGNLLVGHDSSLNLHNIFFVTFFYNIAPDKVFNLNAISCNFGMTVCVSTCSVFLRGDEKIHIHMKHSHPTRGVPRAGLAAPGRH